MYKSKNILFASFLVEYFSLIVSNDFTISILAKAVNLALSVIKFILLLLLIGTSALQDLSSLFSISCISGSKLENNIS